MDDESSNKKDSPTGAGRPETVVWKAIEETVYRTADGAPVKLTLQVECGLGWPRSK